MVHRQQALIRLCRECERKAGAIDCNKCGIPLCEYHRKGKYCVSCRKTYDKALRELKKVEEEIVEEKEGLKNWLVATTPLFFLPFFIFDSVVVAALICVVGVVPFLYKLDSIRGAKIGAKRYRRKTLDNFDKRKNRWLDS